MEALEVLPWKMNGNEEVAIVGLKETGLRNTKFAWRNMFSMASSNVSTKQTLMPKRCAEL